MSKTHVLTLLLAVAATGLMFNNCSDVSFQEYEKPSEYGGLGFNDRIEEFSVQGKSLSRGVMASDQAATVMRDTAEKSVLVSSSTILDTTIVTNAISTESTGENALMGYTDVDIVISVDSSGSMSDEIQELKTQLSTFISTLTDQLNLRVMVVYGRVAEEPFFSGCYDLNKQLDVAARDAVVAEAQTFIDGIPTNVNGESPIYFGIKTYADHTPSCFRQDSLKFLFAITDEDERNVGDAGSTDINNTTKTTYINQLNASGIMTFSVVHLPTGNVLRDISEATNGKTYAFSNSLASNLAEFANDIKLKVSLLGALDLATEPVVAQSVRVMIENGPELVEGTDYNLSTSLTSVSLTESGLGKIDSVGKKVIVNFVKASQLNQISATHVPINVTVNSVDQGACAAVSGGGMAEVVYGLSSCVSDWMGGPWRFQVVGIPSKLEVRLDTVAALQAEDVSVWLGSTQLDSSVYTFIPGDNKVIVDHSVVAYLPDSEVRVKYATDPQAMQGLIIPLPDLHQIKGVYFNNALVAEGVCYDVFTDAIKLLDCPQIVPGAEDFSVSVSYSSFASDNFSVSWPGEAVLNTVRVRSQDNSFNVRGMDLTTVDGMNFLLPAPMELVGTNLHISYLTNDNFKFLLSDKPSEEHHLMVYLNKKVLSETLFSVVRSKPYAIVIDSSVALQPGDSVAVKYQR